MQPASFGSDDDSPSAAVDPIGPSPSSCECIVSDEPSSGGGVHDEQYRAIFEATSDGLVINDLETGLVLEANPAMCRMHGYDNMTGMDPADFIHPSCQYLFAQYAEAAGAGREFRCRAQDVRRDGSIFDVEVIGRKFSYQGRPAVIGVVRDVTAHAQAFHDLEQRVVERTNEIERRREVAEGLRDLLAIVNSRRSLGEILDHVVVQSRELLGGDASAIFMMHTDIAGESLVVGASSGLEEQFTQVKLPIEKSSTGLAFTRRRAVVVPDVRASLPSGGESESDLVVIEEHGYIRVVKFPSILESLQVQAADDDGNRAGIRAFAQRYGAMVAVPLAVKDEAYGTLSLYFYEPREFGADEVALARAFADQTALAIENARLWAQAEQAAVLEERQRIARDLHDAVTQTLFSASLIADVLPQLWSVDPADAERRLAALQRLTRGALDEMRLLLVELRPGAIENVSLDDLLRQLCSAMSGTRTLQIDLQITNLDSPRLPHDVKLALYRIAQEALNNVSKHANASLVCLTLYRDRDHVRLAIADDGTGFSGDPKCAGRFGLEIMNERAQGVGAELNIESGQGRGSCVEVTWQMKHG